MNTISQELKQFDLQIVKKISKGYSSDIFLLKNKKGKKFALKLERIKSTRKNMVFKESSSLEVANNIGIAPKLFAFDEKNKFLIMEFIEGKRFCDWVLEKKLNKKVMKKFLINLFVQAKKLDKIGLDHGQLGGKAKNILVRKNLPVIIDFEKSSQVRRVHNAAQLKSLIFFNKEGFVALRIKEIVGESAIKKIISKY
ncbi:MAG: RIO1 family regulatory kinase/ATPase [archaeon]|nr:RIO1 family regulatory kinase/ATPase [archaeon]